MSVLCDEAENIGADIEAPKRVKTPIGLNGSNFGVMGIERGVLRPNKLLWHCSPEKDTVDSVMRICGSVLIERCVEGRLVCDRE